VTPFWHYYYAPGLRELPEQISDALLVGRGFSQTCRGLVWAEDGATFVVCLGPAVVGGHRVLREWWNSKYSYRISYLGHCGVLIHGIVFQHR
jgi:hypothetical protein